MSDKERLEEIKKKYNYERLVEFIDAKPVNPYELKWLIEQAERVQELENHLKLYDFWYRTAYEQNKRYREALEHIERIQSVDVAQQIARQALEGTE